MKTYVWEMDARNEGREEGREEGVAALISTLREFGCSKADTLHKVMEKMELSESVAEEYIEKYWRE